MRKNFCILLNLTSIFCAILNLKSGATTTESKNSESNAKFEWDIKADGGSRKKRAPVANSLEIMCEARGRGTSEFVDCPKKTCRAHVDCWVAYGKPQQCVCDAQFCGLVCLPVTARCPIPVSPENGLVTFRDSKIGDTADYSCSQGFTVMGPRKRHCLGTQTWSGPEPICTNQSDYCFAPPYIPNAIVSDISGSQSETEGERSNYRNEESITMICRSGFEDVKRKSTLVKCIGSQWMYDTLDCQRIWCPEVGGPVNGRTLYTSDLRYQATAVQFCNDGYEIKCSEQKNDKSCVRFCQADGTWSGENADCQTIRCPKLEKPENGFVSGFWNTVNSIVAFECDEGYELIGSAFRRCQSSGLWDGEPALCKVRDCGTLPPIKYAVLKYSSTVYNSKAYFKCEAGTTPSIASSEIICKTWENKTQWIPYPLPSCYRHCSIPIITNSLLSIQTNNDSSPSNVETQTSQQTVVSGILVEHRTMLRVTCNQGYNLAVEKMTPLKNTQSGSMTCYDKSWNVTYQCVPARCLNRPPHIPNAIVRFYSLNHGSIASYSCLPGYILNVSNNEKPESITIDEPHGEKNDNFQFWTKFSHNAVMCSFGQWVGQPPECKPIFCKRPHVVDGVRIHLLGARGRWPFDSDSISPAHGAVVEYSCLNDEQQVVGPRNSFCVEGYWSPPNAPKCQIVMHDTIPRQWLYQKP